MEVSAYTKKKNRHKRFRTLIELLIIALALYVLAHALFTFTKYQPTGDSASQDGNRGFIALSYFGVDRIGNNTLIGKNLLEQHLQTLHQRGYVTVTQQDILDYYKNGKQLPAKSLYLMFEDGRRDTAIFAQDALEANNFIGTMFTYPEKFDNEDTKFLLPKDLKSLLATSYWEMGSNGYRLYFINVFDRYNNYLGAMGPLEHSMVASTLGRKYNHYLMDYIRDEKGYPLESYQVMKNRVDYDYSRLAEIYKQELGFVPQAYALMHANTGSFGNNPRVAAENKYWLEKLFKMNFNREGYCKNVKASGLYDLTRMEPQAYWPVNHLLTRINDDTNQKLAFVHGDENRYNKWLCLQGGAEFQTEKIILTTKTKAQGQLRLKNSNDYKNLFVTVDLLGNKYGQQTIYLRTNDSMSSYVSVGIVNNFLVLTDKSTGQKKELLKLNLDRLDGKPAISVEEDKKAVIEQELKTFSRYADSAETAKIYVERLKDKEIENARTIEQGSPEYQPLLSYHARGSRHLEITLNGQQLNVKVDGKQAGSTYTLAGDSTGSVYLEAAWGGYGWSQINLADDVYDGVFSKLIIKADNDQGAILYDDRLSGWAAFKFRAKNYFMAVVGWFISHL